MDARRGTRVTKRCVVLATAVLLTGVVSGCKEEHPVVLHSSSRGMDRPAERACTVFAARYGRADTTVAGLRLADEVGRSAARSDNGAVFGRAGRVGRSATRGDASWWAASKSLLQACRKAVWKP
jgi:hypothetical protein